MLLAALTTALWPLLNSSIDPVFPGFLVSLVVLVGVSLVTRHAKDESVKAVYWEDLPTATSRMNSDNTIVTAQQSQVK